jgi:hypothetical protein
MKCVLAVIGAVCLVSLSALLAAAADPQVPRPNSRDVDRVPRIAAVVTEYRRNSHADVIVGRLLESYSLDGRGEFPRVKLVSLYTDQRPDNDLSRPLARQHGFRLCDTVAEALTLGGDALAVDGVLLVAEHGKYPKSETGQTQYPKRRLFGEIAAVFESSGRSVPVFLDKHLSDNWNDAKQIYETARRLQVPLMAGSSLPTAWRDPPIDVNPKKPLREMVGVSYGSLDAYGFHALEMVQVLAERRPGGETGIRAVQCLEGDAVWEAGQSGVYDRKLLEAALSRLKLRPIPPGKRVEDLVRQPVLFVVDYRDGLRTSILTLNGAVAEWAVAWKANDEQIDSTLFEIQDGRPYDHFTYLVKGIEQMMHTGRPTWPVERTLLTSGTLDALLISKTNAGRRVETPYLGITYRADWEWTQPPPPADLQPRSRPR